MATTSAAKLYLENLKPKEGVLRVIPLGGIGEIGMNCYLFEFDGELLLVDCGQMMPDEELLGVDYVIPDVTYLEERLDRLTGIVLTHAHEDHVGGLPYILPRLRKDVPVYGSELTIALQKEKIREHGLKPNYKVMTARQKITLGKNFVVEPLTVTHSIIDAFALAITTPIGTVIHSGDYKMDPAPMDGVTFDYHGFSRHAEGPDEGVLLLLGDSTNANRHGMCPSESIVAPTLTRLVREARGQVILSCFASSLHRIQLVLNIAAREGRVVFPAGLNMERNIRVASSLGALEIPGPFEFDVDKAKNYPPEKRLILTTGSQGEPMSALSRVALGSHRSITIQKGDTVILSARMIPGNEKAIYRLINHFARHGAKIHYPANTPDIHVSGHAYRDDMRHLINLVNPRLLVPIHGEYRHLRAHAELGEEMGLLPEEIHLLDNGDCLEVNAEGEGEIIGKVPHGRVFVDGKGIGDVQDTVIRDRRFLSEDGVVLVILSVDRESGEVLSGPYIHTRGFVSEDAEPSLLEEASRIVLDAYNGVGAEEKEESAVVQAAVKKALRTFLKKETRRFPVILPVIMEI